MDLNSIKNKLNKLQTQGQKKEKVDYGKFLWKPKAEGKYQIRIVPSKLDATNPFREVFIHYGFAKFPIYALSNWGEKDPIEEFAKQLRQTDDKENWKLSSKLSPKMRVFAPIIVRGEEDKGVLLWEFGKEIYMQLLSIADDEDYGDYTDINEGRDFTVTAVKDTTPQGISFFKCTLQIKPKTSVLSADKTQIKTWLSEQPDILEIQRKSDFATLKGILQNYLNPEAETEVVEEAEEEETDLPFKVEPVKTPINSTVKKTSKSKKFDELFEDEN